MGFDVREEEEEEVVVEVEERREFINSFPIYQSIMKSLDSQRGKMTTNIV